MKFKRLFPGITTHRDTYVEFTVLALYIFNFTKKCGEKAGRPLLRNISHFSWQAFFVICFFSWRLGYSAVFFNAIYFQKLDKAKQQSVCRYCFHLPPLLMRHHRHLSVCTVAFTFLVMDICATSAALLIAVLVLLYVRASLEGPRDVLFARRMAACFSGRERKWQKMRCGDAEDRRSSLCGSLWKNRPVALKFG